MHQVTWYVPCSQGTSSGRFEGKARQDRARGVAKGPRWLRDGTRLAGRDGGGSDGDKIGSRQERRKGEAFCRRCRVGERADGARCPFVVSPVVELNGWLVGWLAHQKVAGQ